jgi:hypothetical protein
MLDRDEKVGWDRTETDEKEIVPQTLKTFTKDPSIIGLKTIQEVEDAWSIFNLRSLPILYPSSTLTLFPFPTPLSPLPFSPVFLSSHIIQPQNKKKRRMVLTNTSKRWIHPPPPTPNLLPPPK